MEAPKQSFSRIWFFRDALKNFKNIKIEQTKIVLSTKDLRKGKSSQGQALDQNAE